ncbi:MAG: MetS family NSS transporter small subunit [Candidatus Aminicenantes bacterium]|nr:MetS family NSS transporter small subunit [Candidatus Aminicenantes bacterium]
MTTEALIFMIFTFAVCIGGFIYSLYLTAKNK